MMRTTAGPVLLSSLKTVRGMIRLRCLGIFDQQGGRRKGRERGGSEGRPRRRLGVSYVKGQAVSRCGEGRVGTVICPDPNHFVTAAGQRYVSAIVPERFGKGGPIVSLPGTVLAPSCHKGRQRLGA